MPLPPPAPARLLDRCICVGVGLLCVAVGLSPGGWALLQASVVPHSSHLDWCEENYTHSRYVAEFWNTITGAAMLPVAGGVLVMVTCLGHLRFRAQSVFLVFGLAAIGLGSIYFHAQLSVLGQVLDEVAICWTNTYAMFFPLRRSRMEVMLGRRAVALIHTKEFLSCVVIVTPIMGVLYPVTSHVLTLITLPATVATTTIAYRGLSARGRAEGSAPFWRATYYTAVGFTCWLLDRLACSAVRDTLGFNPQFHACWHVLIFGAAWNVTVFMFFVTAENEKEEKERHQLRPILCGTQEVWEMIV